MRVTMEFAILLSHFIMLSLMNPKIVEGTIQYGRLVEDVYEKYMTKSIIFIPIGSYFSFEHIGDLQKLSRDFSAKGIPSLILNYMHLEKGMSYHSSHESKRPLIALFFNEITQLQKFRQIMHQVDMSYSQPLVVFLGDSDEDHCKYCRNPMGNLFKLKFNSRMLVMCCESEYIEEWWSAEVNKTSTIPRGKWIEEVNKVNWYPEERISAHRHSLHNRGFRIVTVKGSLFAWKDNRRVRGFFGGLLTELSRIMNFSIAHVTEENLFGIWDSEFSKWSGAMDLLVRDEADMGVADFIMTSERIQAVDFTLPIFTFKRALIIKKPDNVDILWDAWLKPFHRRIWIVITILLLITPILLTIIKYTRKDNFIDMLGLHYLNVWGVLCQKPLPDSPSGIPLRIVYITIYVMTVVVYAAYSASFISYLTITSSSLPFNSLREFTEDGTYKLIVVKDSVAHQELEMFDDELTMKLKANMLPRNSLPRTNREAWKQICIQRVAFYYADVSNYVHPPCDVVSIPSGGVLNIGIILPVNGEFTEVMNHYIRQFQYNGMMSRLENKYFTKKDVPDTPYVPVSFAGVISILIIFTLGFSIAFIIFCIELP